MLLVVYNVFAAIDGSIMNPARVKFLVAGLISVLIAIITVTYQSIKAAGTNPADTLRYE